MPDELDPIKLLAVPLDEISVDEMEQLRLLAERHDWQAMRDQLLHYGQRYRAHLQKEKENKS